MFAQHVPNFKGLHGNLKSSKEEQMWQSGGSMQGEH